MKVVLTALQNENVHNKLLKYDDIQILNNDIQYKEGIIEILEINPNIDYIIISELLPGEIEIKELIEKIKNINQKINCIIILENKKEELENYLLSKGKINIFYNNQITVEGIVNIIKENTENETIKNEILEIKKIIKNNYNTDINTNKREEENIETIITQKEINEIENQMQKEYEINTIKNIISNLFKNNKKETENKTICVLGESGVR